MTSSPLTALAQIISQSRHLVFLGGAGVSTASGIPDFRSATGLYSQNLNRHFSPEELISRTFYTRYPEDFFAFYKSHLVYPAAKPNACHIALAALEKKGLCKAVVTQNIDGLHQEAGSERVLELHGSVHRNYCESCHGFYSASYILSAPGVPLCQKCGARVKPDVVLYEEPLAQNVLSDAVGAINDADTLVIGGTSLIVHPAASLIQYFKGKNLVVINKTLTPADKSARLVFRDDIALVFDQVMELL